MTDEEKPLLEGMDAVERRCRRNQILASGTVTAAVAIFGCSTGFSAVALPTLLNPASAISVTPFQASWVASLISPFCMLGCFCSGVIAEKAGRKGTLLLAALCMLAAWLFIALTTSLSLLLIGRALAGFATGISEPQVQVYICEVTQAWLRGLMSTATGVTVMLGIFYVYGLGSLVHWQTVAACCTIPPALLIAVLAFMPESPVWLLSRGRTAEAERALRWLRGNGDVSTELRRLQRCQRRNQQFRLSKTQFFKRLLSPCVWKPFMIAIALFFFQEFAGVYSVTFYQVSFLEDSKSSINPYIATVALGAIRIASMILTCYLLAYLGRRQLLLLSWITMAVSMAALGGAILLQDDVIDPQTGWLPFACFVLYTIGFCLGAEPLPFLMAPELLPSDIRGAGTGVCIFFFEMFRFINVEGFLYIQKLLQPYGLCWCYGVFSLLGAIFTAFCVPETKDKELEEIEAYFQKRPFIPEELRESFALEYNIRRTSQITDPNIKTIKEVNQNGVAKP